MPGQFFPQGVGHPLRADQQKKYGRKYHDDNGIAQDFWKRSDELHAFSADKCDKYVKEKSEKKDLDKPKNALEQLRELNFQQFRNPGKKKINADEKSRSGDRGDDKNGRESIEFRSVIELHGKGSSVEIQKAIDVEENDVIKEKIQKFVVVFFPEFVGQEYDRQSQKNQKEIDQD